MTGGGLGGAVGSGRRTLDLARRAEVTFLAAAIAYYGLVSVLPAVVLALAVASALGGARLAELVLALAGSVVTPAGREVIEAALLGAGGRTGATLLGTVVLVWGALKGLRGLDRAFSRVYGTSAALTFAEGVRNAATALVGIGAAVGLMVALGGVLAALSLPVAGWVLGLVVLLVGLFAAFLPVYVLFPNLDVGVGEAAPGAAVAAGGWLVLQAAFQLYAALAPVGDLYGVLGGVLLLVTWFYLAAVLVLLGAVLNAVLAGRDGAADRQAEKAADRGD